MNNNHVVIMAGGVGSRFWPLSTPEYPKQFIDILGMGRTLIQLTFDRFRNIVEPQNVWVVTNEKYVNIVKEQLPDIPAENILAEPAARNTAPCIAWACWCIRQKCEEANIVVTPSDAIVMDTSEFQRVISNSLSFTQTSDAIVTIGIKPNRPETGYGYVQYNGTSPSSSAQAIKKVIQFKEKPSLETAKQYVGAGNYLWNAGIFVWNVRTISAAISKYKPQIASLMDEMVLMASDIGESSERRATRIFPLCEKISIDYAVMEPAASDGIVYTHPADFGWSDLGNWQSLHEKLPKDADNNACVGNVRFIDSSNNIVHMERANRVVLQGLDGYIVSEVNGDFLICKRSEEQHIKEWN